MGNDRVVERPHIYYVWVTDADMDPKATLANLVNGEGDRPRATWRVTLVSLFAYVVLFGGVVVVLTVLPALGVPAEAPYTLAVNGVVSLVAAALTLEVAARVDRRPVAEYGFRRSRRWWTDLGAGLVVGVVVAAVSTLVGLLLGYGEVVETLSGGESGPFVLLVLLTLIGMTGIVVFEETLFRGVLITNVAEGFSARGASSTTAVVVALVVSTLLFVPPHFVGGVTMEGESLASATVGYFLMGLLWGIAYALTGRLALPLGMHLAYNSSNATAFAPTEPFAEGYATLLRLDFVTGGYYNSVRYDLVAFAVGLLAVGGWVYATRGEVSVADELARWRDDETADRRQRDGSPTDA